MLPYEERKLSGEFYTPQRIVSLMVQRTLAYYLKLNVRTESKNILPVLLRMKILDPCIGTGNYILGLLNYLKKVGKKDNQYSEYYNSLTSLSSSFLKNNLYGLELNRETLISFKKTIGDLYKTNISKCRFYHGNFIVEEDVYSFIEKQEADVLLPFSWEKNGLPTSYDIIIGNPPYYNLKKTKLIDEQVEQLRIYLSQSSKWSEYYRSDSDICYYFIIKSLKLLKKGGILSFIVPNYWIQNKYADKLRAYLSQYNVLEIINFKDLKLFQDGVKKLNVNNCILTVQKEEPSKKTDVYEYNIKKNKQFESLCLNEYFDHYTIPQTTFGQSKWRLTPHLNLIKELEQNKHLVPLDTLAYIAQGVSPGAKDIFVLTKKEVDQYQIEQAILKPFITNKNINRWIIEETDKLGIFPYKKNLSDFPNAKKYLEEHRTKLIQGSDRRKLLAKNKIRWYDYSVYRNIELLLENRSKILCPYRSKKPSFGLDEKNYLGATDIYAIVPEDNNLLYYILGILNSSSYYFWFSVAGKRKGNMLEFFSTPLKKSLIPLACDEKTAEIVDITKRIIEAKQNQNCSYYLELEEELNKIVARLYELDFAFVTQYEKRAY